MTPSARLSAAIEVFADIETRRRPAGDALKDWGLSHRFAGSGDRAAIAGLVYDGLRRKASSAWLMGEASPRAVLIGMLRRERDLSLPDIEALCSGGRFAPLPLTDAETAALTSGTLAAAPAHVQGDYPDWLDPYLTRTFGDERAAEGEVLASRAPLDLRVNALATDRDDMVPRLAHLGAEPTRWSPVGLRIRLAPDAKSPGIHSEPPYLKGQIEIQDEGSQLASLLADAKPGEQVIDLCAGAGGKTLALAAAMENHGQIYATDSDKRRLAAIHERIARADAHNIQVRTPKGSVLGSSAGAADILSDLAGRADLVLIDAPCTGTGTWRRNPDAKWRIRPGALAERLKQQEAVLERAPGLVNPCGRIVYITCSALAEENGDQIRAFAGRHPDFSVEKPVNVIKALGERAYLFGRAVLISAEGLLMTPRRTETDGFFVSMLRRSA
jgi:16S rRNA (cytosine967-C5)-methyltransferase